MRGCTPADLARSGRYKPRSASADRGDSLKLVTKLTDVTPRTGGQENPKGVALPTPEWEKKSDLKPTCVGAHQPTLQGLHKSRSASADRGDSLKLTVDTPRTGVQENPKGVALPTPEWEKKSDPMRLRGGGATTSHPSVDTPYSDSDSETDTTEDCERLVWTAPSTLRPTKPLTAQAWLKQAQAEQAQALEGIRREMTPYESCADKWERYKSDPEEYDLRLARKYNALTEEGERRYALLECTPETSEDEADREERELVRTAPPKPLVPKKKLSFPSPLTRIYDLTLGLAPLPRALWLRASIQAKARDLAAAGFSRRDIHRWHNRWIPQKKAARPPRSLDVVSTPRGGQPIETIRRPKEKPRHRGVDPPAVLPLVVRTALRLMECHRPTRRPPPTHPGRPRAGPAQTYAPPQPLSPHSLHTTREEWRDLLFLSYEYHAKRERWRSC